MPDAVKDGDSDAFWQVGSRFRRNAAVSKGDEAGMLKARVRMIQGEMNALNERIKELDSLA